jgi:hypothetical protein
MTTTTIKATPGAMHVRLKPYNPRQGYVMRRFRAFGIEFVEGRGWYEVPRDIADYLRTVRSNGDASPFAFDVCTAESAQQIEENEKRMKEHAAAAAAAPRVVRVNPTIAVPTPPPASPAETPKAALTSEDLPKAPAARRSGRRRVAT